ncbi:GNAT family N-acetyltransferase [Lentzea sp. JNUCC 0626]|uniref:GNAT family N-acetyltransferase n=1 Tax=Lentzea sp. JNUCC 0626 TaxID=3367513 RepID=UPI00374A422A
MTLVAQDVTVRQLTSHADLLAAQRLFESIWQGDVPPVTAELLRAMAKAGNYVAGAFDGDLLVGACAGFCSPPAARSLHSHIAGVAAGTRGRAVGLALKLDQRQWALDRDITEISWTFDPLVRRNAHFNLTKLAAEATEYLPDFYGDMHDGINAGAESDRLLVTWRITDPVVPRTVVVEGSVALGISDGLPVLGNPSGATVLVAVPPDVETLRTTNPAAAREWRHAVREVLGSLLAEGARVTGFDRSGWYAVERNTQ